MKLASAIAKIVIAGWLIAAAGVLSAKEAFPTRPVRIVVPFAAGGSTGALAQLLAARLGKLWEQQVIVDPRGGGNTVIGIIATNAKLDRVQTNKLAALGSIGVVRTISPINTMSDGDITFAVSLGNEKATVDEAGVAAADVMVTAVLRAVRAAKTAAGIPGLAG